MSSEEFNNNDEVEFENEEEAGSSSENEGSDSMQVGDPLDTSIRPREKATKRKRSGRKTTWPEPILDDLVDIVCEDEYLRRKIIFANNKNSKNTEVYNKVVRLLSARCEDRRRHAILLLPWQETNLRPWSQFVKRHPLQGKLHQG